YLQEPLLVEVARPNATATNVEQRFYKVDDDDKRAVVRQILRDRQIGQSIVFVNSKLGAARLARAFERDGLRTSALHGDKSQDERLKSLNAFKAGEVDLLVATDVAARGIDIAALPAVFNFDIPFNAEDYIHRIGRTGRAGASGLAVSLVGNSDARLMGDIEKLLKKKVDVEAFSLESERRPRRESFSDERGAARRPERRFEEEPGPSRPVRSAPRRSESQDPFFNKPYEAASDAEPAWDKGAPTPAHGLSRFIKPKRKVATLLGGSGTTRR